MLGPLQELRISFHLGPPNHLPCSKSIKHKQYLKVLQAPPKKTSREMYKNIYDDICHFLYVRLTLCLNVFYSTVYESFRNYYVISNVEFDAVYKMYVYLVRND